MVLFNRVLLRSRVVSCFLVVAWLSFASAFGFATSPASWRVTRQGPTFSRSRRLGATAGGGARELDALLEGTWDVTRKS